MPNAVKLEQFLRGVDDLDLDSYDWQGTLRELASSDDQRLIPRLHEALERFMDEGNFFGRDVTGEILAGIAGPAVLNDLLRASARDLGDDQDSFAAVITDLMGQDPAAARAAILPLVKDDDSAAEFVTRRRGRFDRPVAG
jgi:hypothetical protein